MILSIDNSNRLDIPENLEQEDINFKEEKAKVEIKDTFRNFCKAYLKKQKTQAKHYWEKIKLASPELIKEISSMYKTESEQRLFFLVLEELNSEDPIYTDKDYSQTVIQEIDNLYDIKDINNYEIKNNFTITQELESFKEYDQQIGEAYKNLLKVYPVRSPNFYDEEFLENLQILEINGLKSLEITDFWQYVDKESDNYEDSLNLYYKLLDYLADKDDDYEFILEVIKRYVTTEQSYMGRLKDLSSITSRIIHSIRKKNSNDPRLDEISNKIFDIYKSMNKDGLLYFQMDILSLLIKTGKATNEIKNEIQQRFFERNDHLTSYFIIINNQCKDIDSALEFFDEKKEIKKYEFRFNPKIRAMRLVDQYHGDIDPIYFFIKNQVSIHEIFHDLDRTINKSPITKVNIEEGNGVYEICEIISKIPLEDVIRLNKKFKENEDNSLEEIYFLIYSLMKYADIDEQYLLLENKIFRVYKSLIKEEAFEKTNNSDLDNTDKRWLKISNDYYELREFFYPNDTSFFQNLYIENIEELLAKYIDKTSYLISNATTNQGPYKFIYQFRIISKIIISKNIKSNILNSFKDLLEKFIDLYRNNYILENSFNSVDSLYIYGLVDTLEYIDINSQKVGIHPDYRELSLVINNIKIHSNLYNQQFDEIDARLNGYHDDNYNGDGEDEDNFEHQSYYDNYDVKDFFKANGLDYKKINKELLRNLLEDSQCLELVKEFSKSIKNIYFFNETILSGIVKLYEQNLLGIHTMVAIKKGFIPSSYIFSYLEKNEIHNQPSEYVIEELRYCYLAEKYELKDIRQTFSKLSYDFSGEESHFGFCILIMFESFLKIKNKFEYITKNNDLVKQIQFFYALSLQFNSSSFEDLSEEIEKNTDLEVYVYYNNDIANEINNITESIPYAHTQTTISLVTRYFVDSIQRELGGERLSDISQKVCYNSPKKVGTFFLRHISNEFIKNNDLKLFISEVDESFIEDNINEILDQENEIVYFFEHIISYKEIKNMSKKEAVNLAISNKNILIANIILIIKGVANKFDSDDLTRELYNVDKIKNFDISVYNLDQLDTLFTDIENNNRFPYLNSEILNSIFDNIAKLDESSKLTSIYHSRYGKERKIHTFLKSLIYKIKDFTYKELENVKSDKEKSYLIISAIELIKDSLELYIHTSKNIIPSLKTLNEFVSDKIFKSGIWFSGRDGIPLSLSIKASYWGMNLSKLSQYTNAIRENIKDDLITQELLINDAKNYITANKLEEIEDRDELLNKGISLHYNEEYRIHQFIKFANISRILMDNCESYDDKKNLSEYLKSCGITSKMIAIDTGYIGSVIKKALVILFGGEGKDYDDLIFLFKNTYNLGRSIISDKKLRDEIVPIIENLPKKNHRVIYIDDDKKQYSYPERNDIKILSWVVDQCIIRHFVPHKND